MGHRTIKWSIRSLKNVDKIAEWYVSEMGTQAAVKFLKDLYSTAENVVEMPTIGTLDEICSSAKRKYYYPKYRLIYRYKSHTVYIVGIRSNQRNT